MAHGYAHGMRVEKVAEWQARFERFHQARTSIAQFCRDEGISTPSFYIWRRKLQQMPTSRRGARRNTRGPQGSRARLASEPQRSRFVPVRVLEGGVNLCGPTAMTAELPGGTRLTIPVAGPEALQLAIAALVRADAEQAGARAC